MPKAALASDLRVAYTRMLEQSVLTERDAQRLGYQIYEDARKLDPALVKASGFKIPYFDADGKLDPAFWRFRYLEDTRRGFDKLAGKKPLRYVQPSNSPVRLYLPPLGPSSWRKTFADAAIPIVFTEGEKKAACATKHGIPTIGLGGVWSFMSKRRGEAMIPEFDLIDFEQRTIYICYDSDASTNPNIVAAEARFAEHLLARGAKVLVVRIQSDLAEAKIGLDDYIYLHGAEAFMAMLQNDSYEYEGSEMLHRLNELVVYIKNPGFIHDYDADIRRSVKEFVHESHINLHWEELNASGKAMVKRYAAKEWLEWTSRAALNGIVYAPGEPRITDTLCLNTWRGWGVADANVGAVAAWTELLDSVFHATEPWMRKWFEQWAAYPIQHPGTKLTTGVLLWSVLHGTGKSTVGYVLMRLYGQLNAAEIKDSHLKNGRNEWIGDGKQFVLADDITGKDNRAYQRMLMTMISQKTMTIDAKYVKSYVIEDCVNYLFTSNDPDAFYLDGPDRRFFVHEVRCPVMRKDQRDRINAFMRSEESMQALFHYLQHLDLTGFDPYAPAPDTSAKSEMIRISKSELGAWVAHLKESPDEVLNGRMRGDLFTAEELHVLYDPAGDKRASPNALSRELKRAGFQKAEDTGLMCAIGCRRPYIVRNVDQWGRADRKAKTRHYDENHPVMPGKVKKF